MHGKDLQAAFARNVKARRKELDLTQVQLSLATGLPQPHISAIERGSMAPSFATIATLAEALDTTPSALMSVAYLPALQPTSVSTSMSTAENSSVPA